MTKPERHHGCKERIIFTLPDMEQGFIPKGRAHSSGNGFPVGDLDDGIKKKESIGNNRPHGSSERIDLDNTRPLWDKNLTFDL